MSKILLTADSTCDISGELVSRTQVIFMPLHVVLGDTFYEDGVNIHPDDIYENFEKTGKLPKTAAVNTQEYIDFFRPYVEQGYDIIHISLGSALSSSFQNSAAAAKKLGHVYAIDSCNLSSGSGHLVLEAAGMIAQGMSAKNVAEEIKELIPKCQTSFVIDRLDYLRAGGRCSALAAFGANLLQIKPSIIVSTKDGSMSVGKKYRGKYDQVLVKYVHEQLEKFDKIRDNRIFITHAGVDKKYVDVVYREILKMDYFKEIFIERASCTISSHCGPGTLGILFMTE